MAARRNGYDLTLILSTDEQLAMDRGLKKFQERRVDGLINACWLSPQSHKQVALDPHVRAVLVEYTDPTVLPVVSVDYEAGIHQLVSHLAELRHRRVLWLGPEEDDR